MHDPLNVKICWVVCVCTLCLTEFKIILLFLGTLANLQKCLIALLWLSVHPYGTAASTVWILVKFKVTFKKKNMRTKFKFHQNLTSFTGTVPESLWIFSVVSFWILQMWIFHTSVVEEIETRFMSSNFFPKKSCCEKMWQTQTGHRWKCDTVHSLCVLDHWGYRHTHRIFNTWLFHGKNVYANAPLYYIVHISSLLFSSVVTMPRIMWVKWKLNSCVKMR